MVCSGDVELLVRYRVCVEKFTPLQSESESDPVASDRDRLSKRVHVIMNTVILRSRLSTVATPIVDSILVATCVTHAITSNYRARWKFTPRLRQKTDLNVLALF